VLNQRREAYRVLDQSMGYYAQKRALPALRAANADYRQVGSQVLQHVIRRVELALQAFCAPPLLLRRKQPS
jgi:putative transposase